MASPFIVINHFEYKDQILESINHIGYIEHIQLLLLSSMTYMVRYIRWSILCKSYSLKIPLKRNALIFLSGFALSLTPGRIGESLKARFINSLSVQQKISFGIRTIFHERITDLLAICMLLTAFIFIRLDTVEALVGERLTYLEFNIKYLFICFLILSFLYLPLKRKFNKFENNYRNGSISIDNKIMIRTFTLAVISWGIQGIMVWLIVDRFSIDVNPLDVNMIYFTSLIAGVLSLMPGGLGGFEVVFIMGVRALDIPIVDSILILILIRAYGLWIGVFAGLISWLLLSFYSDTESA